MRPRLIGTIKRARKHKIVVVSIATGVILLTGWAMASWVGNCLLNSYFRRKLEAAFMAAHPGHGLQIGRMAYSWRSNRLSAESMFLTNATVSLRTGRVGLHHADWARLLWRPSGSSHAFSRASLEATNLLLAWPGLRYELRCARLQASVPGAMLSAAQLSFRPQIEDAEFFAGNAYRATRYRLAIPECRVTGLAYAELLAARGWRAHSVEVAGLDLDALVSRYLPPGPTRPPIVTLREALAALGCAIAVDVLVVTNAQVKYAERRTAGAPPGVLRFSAIELVARGLDSRAPPEAVVSASAQGVLMDDGLLKVEMTIPLAASDLSLHYSGSLGAMELPRLNPFLAIAERFRITSGWVAGVEFGIDVSGGRAKGTMEAIYRDLHIAFLDPRTGSRKGIVNRTESFLANAFKIRNANPPDRSQRVRLGKVDYELSSQDTFLKFLWCGLRSGVLDSIGD